MALLKNTDTEVYRKLALQQITLIPTLKQNSDLMTLARKIIMVKSALDWRRLESNYSRDTLKKVVYSICRSDYYHALVMVNLAMDINDQAKYLDKLFLL